MEASTIAAIVAVAALLLNIVLSVRGGAWGMSDRLSTMESRIMAAVADHKSALDATVETLRKECDEKVKQSEHRFGETIAAMQAKIHTFETWTRDTFVRRGSFSEVVTRMEASIAERDGRFDKRFDRLEEKFDELLARKN
jgi:hypothetical protein